MLRNILIHPDPRLKRKADALTDISGDTKTLIEDMFETMYHAPGIGLAAPQIGIMQRVIVLDCVRDEEEGRQPLPMINPKITASSEDHSTYEEGCLSIPEVFYEVTRPAEIECTWLDLEEKEHRQGFDGLWATCIQHEIDHLEGKLFIDYLSPLKKQLVTRKMTKLKRERALKQNSPD